MVSWYPGMSLEQIEKAVIKRSLEINGGNKTQTAQSLGIAIRTLQNKLAEIEAEMQAESDANEARRAEAKKQLARARGISYDNQGRAILPKEEPVEVKPVTQTVSTFDYVSDTQVSAPEKIEMGAPMPPANRRRRQLLA